MRIVRGALTKRLKVEDQEATLGAAKRLVTPFTGFMLSQHYVSKEIDELELSWLNPEATKLSRAKAHRISYGDIVYCQVDQMAEFRKKIMPYVRAPFLLISGKWHLPALSDGDFVSDILNSPNLICWFSQNAIPTRREMRPFPYGVDLMHVAKIDHRMSCVGTTDKRNRLFVPHATIHNHLKGEPRLIRESIKAHMAPHMPIDDYLDEILMSRFVISPPGDRPDTYRHWECIVTSPVVVGFRT